MLVCFSQHKPLYRIPKQSWCGNNHSLSSFHTKLLSELDPGHRVILARPWSEDLSTLHFGQNLAHRVGREKDGQAPRHTFAWCFNLASPSDECKQSLAKMSHGKKKHADRHVALSRLPVKGGNVTAFSIRLVYFHLGRVSRRAPAVLAETVPHRARGWDPRCAACGKTASRAPHQPPPTSAVAESQSAYQSPGSRAKFSHSCRIMVHLQAIIHREGKTLAL